MDKLIKEYETKLVEPECGPGSARWGVQIVLKNDISAVFPYLNAVMKNAWYDHENKVMILREPAQVYAFRPKEIRIGRTSDHLEAQLLAAQIVEEVNHVWRERDNIAPLFTERKLPAVLDIFKLLPKTNCRECGYATCMAYAADLRQGTALLDQCPPLSQKEYAQKRQGILDLISAD